MKRFKAGTDQWFDAMIKFAQDCRGATSDAQERYYFGEIAAWLRSKRPKTPAKRLDYMKRYMKRYRAKGKPAGAISEPDPTPEPDRSENRTAEAPPQAGLGTPGRGFAF